MLANTIWQLLTHAVTLTHAKMASAHLLWNSAGTQDFVTSRKALKKQQQQHVLEFQVKMILANPAFQSKGKILRFLGDDKRET